MKGHIDASEQLMAATMGAADRIIVTPVVEQRNDLFVRCQNIEGELQRAKKKLEQAEGLLTEALEYLEERYDTNDGDEGRPSPNREMSLGTSIDEFLNGRAY